MKTISDRDLDISCDFVAEGETNDEVIENASSHIQAEHPEEWDRVKNMMKTKIRNA